MARGPVTGSSSIPPRRACSQIAARADKKLRPGMLLTSTRIRTVSGAKDISQEDLEKEIAAAKERAAAAEGEERAEGEEGAEGEGEAEVKATPTPAPPPPPAPEPEPEDNTLRTIGLIALILIVIGMVIWFMRKKD